MFVILKRFLSTSLRRTTFISGDGNSPVIINGVEDIFKAVNAPVEIDKFELNSSDPNIVEKMDKIIESVKTNGTALKSNWITRLKQQTESLNHTFRCRLDLCANVVHVKSYKKISSRSDVDFIIVRQNTEGEYSQIEHENIPGVVEMYRVITANRTKQIAQFAFDIAKQRSRNKVTCIHKANIMKMGDGLFLNTCRDVASRNNTIAFNDMIVDNFAMQLVQRPSQFDIVLLPNLYGNIAVAIGAGLVGSNGILAGANYSEDRKIAVFEVATRGVGDSNEPDYTNPMGVIFAACQLLRHVQLPIHAKLIEDCLNIVVSCELVRTPDIGGSSTTEEFFKTIISEIKSQTKNKEGV